MAEPACVGVVRDNGLACGRGIGRKNVGTHPYELRGGGESRGPGTAWVCRPRLERDSGDGKPLVSTSAPKDTLSAKEGYVFIVLGACAQPSYDCTFVREVREAIKALRASVSTAGRPIAVIGDGGIGAAPLMATLKPDVVHMIPRSVIARSNVAQVSDIRVRKLLAYMHPPFERNIFFDGDTHVRTAKVELMFSTLESFDLAAAFECCRLDYQRITLGYDPSGLLMGWEMQTGVMAYKRSNRLTRFWEATIKEYESRATSYWNRRSSGEQGAATLALARSDLRFLPLPPSFNARPFTMYSYMQTFGLPVYHGKELWKGLDLSGKPAHVEAIIAERMLRDWDQTRDILAAQFEPQHLLNASNKEAALRGLRRMHRRQQKALRQNGNFG